MSAGDGGGRVISWGCFGPWNWSLGLGCWMMGWEVRDGLLYVIIFICLFAVIFVILKLSYSIVSFVLLCLRERFWLV